MAGAVLGFLAVALGAFGAHGLQGRVEERLLEVFEVGVRYQFYHALALLVVGLFMRGDGGDRASLSVAAGAFLVGVVVFSGSLYLMTATGLRWLGAITPLGGVSFLVGWVALFLWGCKAR